MDEALWVLKLAAQQEAAHVNANTPQVVHQPLGRNTIVVTRMIITKKIAQSIQMSFHPPASFGFASDRCASYLFHFLSLVNALAVPPSGS